MIQTRIRKRDNRRVYDVRLRDTDGKEYSKTFLTKREAEAFESSERTARNRGRVDRSPSRLYSGDRRRRRVADREHHQTSGLDCP